MKKEKSCGRCGKATKKKHKNFNSLCDKCKVPHQLMTRIDGMIFRCDYCGQQGPTSQLEETDCTHLYQPCEICGGAPYCDPDCGAIAEIFSRPDVYVAGFQRGD